MTDYREPELRPDVFLDFYEFHLRYRAHPGCVYYLMPFLREAYGWDDEQALWFAFINGNTQNPLTSLILHRRAPVPGKADALVDFWREHYPRLAFDTDRRYHKKSLDEAVAGYCSLAGGDQRAFWHEVAEGGFAEMWRAATHLPTFGRLSAYSYLEYLRVMGVPFDCDTLMLNDRSGSKSHRNGLCKVFGLDEYDWHASNPDFDGRYPAELIARLEDAGSGLLNTMRDRAAGQPWADDVSYFTLESALCTYKSWHRPDRRYPNVYNDMLYLRIKKAQEDWPEEDLDIFWEARAECLPEHLRLEDNPHDPGCTPVKQNHYRLTGQVIMMDAEYPQYENDFNTAVREGRFPERSV